MIHSKDLEHLVELIESSEKGNQLLSSYIFFALGGEVRLEPTSKQGGKMTKFPYWSGENDPCTGIAFSTNTQDWISYLDNQRIEFSIICLEGVDGRGYLVRINGSAKYAVKLQTKYEHYVNKDWHEAKTLPLAICLAMLRSEHVVKNVCDVGPSLWAPEDSRVLPDDPITMGDR